MRMTELAVNVLMTPSGVTRLIDQMVERGLVLRKPDPNDARGQCAVLTPEGKALLRKSSTAYHRAVRRHFADRFSEEQLTVLAETFEAALAQPEASGAR